MLETECVFLGAQANQDLPFEHVMELVKSPIAHTPIFQVILVWQNNSAEPAELPGLELEHVGIGDRVAQHDLALDLAEVGDAICGRLIYATSLFERSTVDRFVGYLQQALSQMAADPGSGDLGGWLCPPESSPTNSGPGLQTAVMNFIEGTRVVTEGELQANSITRYHVTKFYREQITNSGYYDQLKYIVEPSFEEFESPGNLDTSGEHDNTVVPGLQHKYAQTGLLLVTDRCASYCRFCFRKRIVGKDSEEIAPDFAQIAQYIGIHPEMTNVLLSGGDPFVLSTAKLDKILDHLLPIPHLDSIRFGTKMVAY
nr:condensation domain-containing protein [Mesorhizobium sp.]